MRPLTFQQQLDLHRQAGSALIQFTIVAPILVMFCFLSFKYSIIVSTRPNLEANLRTVLEAASHNSYRASGGVIAVDAAAAARNVSLMTAPLATSASRATVMLSLEHTAHQLMVAAFDCRCANGCTGPLASKQVDSNLFDPTSAWPGMLQQACQQKFQERLANDDFSSELDCSTGTADSRACYAAAVHFSVGFSTDEAVVAKLEGLNGAK
jgi:hypothetical protein